MIVILHELAEKLPAQVSGFGGGFFSVPKEERSKYASENIVR